MLDHGNHFPTKREADFYLTRILGPKFAVLVALLVLYLSIRHQLITNLPATVVNLGLAHADAWVRLALAGDPDAITTFTNGHKSYRLTRFSIAHAGLFIECWREVLWQIERGTIVAVALFAAPPLVWLNLCSAWELWRHPAQQLQRASLPLPSAQAVDLAAREVLAPPLDRFAREPVQDARVGNPAPEQSGRTPVEVSPILPTAVPRKRIRKQAVGEVSEPLTSPPKRPQIQPGQSRKRRKPEA
jgi:hypothetical protein